MEQEMSYIAARSEISDLRCSLNLSQIQLALRELEMDRNYADFLTRFEEHERKMNEVADLLKWGRLESAVIYTEVIKSQAHYNLWIEKFLKSQTAVMEEPMEDTTAADGESLTSDPIAPPVKIQMIVKFKKWLKALLFSFRQLVKSN